MWHRSVALHYELERLPLFAFLEDMERESRGPNHLALVRETTLWFHIS